MTEPNRTHPDYDWCIGSSELGSCIKAQAARRLTELGEAWYQPVPTSETMQGYYDRGHEHEDICIDAMNAEGWQVVERQVEEVIDCGDRVGVIVHLDGIVAQGVLEVKAPSAWASFERAVRTDTFTDPYMHRIAWQVSCQMVATGLEAVIACWTEEDGVRTFGIERPPYGLDAIRSRVGDIKRIVASGQLPVSCSQSDYPCPYVYLHETAPAPDHNEQIDSLVLEYAQAVGVEKAAKEVTKGLRDRIGELLEGDKYHSNAGKVTRYVQTRITYDTAKMLLDGMDLSAYEKVTNVPTMKITPTHEGGRPFPTDVQTQSSPNSGATPPTSSLSNLPTDEA